MFINLVLYIGERTLEFRIDPTVPFFMAKGKLQMTANFYPLSGILFHDEYLSDDSLFPSTSHPYSFNS